MLLWQQNFYFKPTTFSFNYLNFSAVTLARTLALNITNTIKGLYRILNNVNYPLQRRIEKSVEHLRWSVFAKLVINRLSAVNYFRKKLHLRCSIGFWIGFCVNRIFNLIFKDFKQWFFEPKCSLYLDFFEIHCNRSNGCSTE